MATSYEEIFASKLDWTMPFQRTGKFPLDRSSMFSSYDDALAYAKQDGTDSRELGGTSYVGQIVTVYGNDAGVEVDGSKVYGTEVAAYIITGVGEGAALQKLAQTTATGDFATDIANLQAALSALAARVTALENAEKVVDTDTTYTFSTAVDTEGAIKIVTKNPDKTETSQEVQVRGWESLVAIANGRTTAYVYQNKLDEAYIEDIKTENKFKLGDLIYFRDAKISDQWVSIVLDVEDVGADGIRYAFTDLETDHPDLSGYLTSSDAANTYATQEALSHKADASTVNTLSQTVSQNQQSNTESINSINSKLGEVKTDAQGNVISLQTQINNIDVSSQIDAKINALDVDIVGGATGSYIKSIKQVDGKIEATAATLPDYSETYEAKGAAADALAEAKSYAEDQRDAAKSYTDTEILATNTNLGKVESRVGTLEITVGSHTTKIGEAETTISSNTSRISTLETTAANLGSSVTQVTNRVVALEDKVTNGVVAKVKVGGVEVEKDSTGAVNITQISTDLLVQGKNTLVLDCGSANGTYSN